MTLDGQVSVARSPERGRAEQPQRPSPGERSWTTAQRVVVAVAALLGVLARWWGLGTPGLSFDESFTAAYSALPIGQLPAALRANDSHPPLDYLLRHPLVDLHSDLWLRAPSAMFSCLAIAAVVVWMRRRSWFGVAMVTLFALNPFQVLYGRQARMYALMTLLGVIVAMVAERWCRGDERPRVVVTMGALVALACLDHTGGLFLAAGVVAVAGLRTDRSAWWWRAGAVAGVAVWVVVWGGSFHQQVEVSSSSWVPLTSPGTLASTISGLLSMFQGAEWLLVVLVALGAVALWRVDRVAARLWVALFLVPLALLAAAGVHFHVLLSRTLAASAWAAPMALAALVAAAWSRRAVLGAAVAVLVVTLSVRSVPAAASYDEGVASAFGQAAKAFSPGDEVLVHPGWFWPVAWSSYGAERTEASFTEVGGVDGWLWTVPGAEATGRVWVLRPASYAVRPELPACADETALAGGWRLGCLVTGGP